MAYYKFLQSQHINLLLGGKFRFGRLRYYQLLETVTEDQWIGDMDEGRAINLIDRVVLQAGDGQEAIRTRLVDGGINVDANASLTLYDSQTISDLDCFVFSVSRGELSLLKSAMCSPEKPDYAYNACVRISGLRHLAHTIWNEGVLCHNGQCVSDAFWPPMTDPVIYSRNVTDVDITTSSLTKASPFIKKVNYSAQSEVRIVLIPRHTIDRDYVTITSAAATRYLSRQFCDNAAEWTSPPSRTAAQILEDLHGVVVEVQKVRDTNRIPPEMLHDREKLKSHMEDVARREREIMGPHETKMAKLYWELRKSEEKYRDSRMDMRLLILGRHGSPAYMLSAVEWFLATHR